MELFGKITPYDWIVVGLGFFTYYLYVRKIKKERGSGQSILSWIIWVILDITQIFITIREDGYSALLLLIFIIGGMYVIRTLHDLKNIFTLSFLDIVTIILIIVCFFIVNTSEEKNIAIIFASMVQFMAGIPLLQTTWRDPKKEYLIPNIGFLAINLIGLRSLVFNKFAIEDHLLQMVLVFYMVIIISMIIFKKPKRN